MTLSHVTKQPPIIGIGSGEAENIIPYGLGYDSPVGVFEEALQVIRLCLESDGAFDYSGKHFQLDRAIMDLRPKKGNEPQIWVAAHGPRMLRLAGTYADGWYPALPLTAPSYESKLATIHEAARTAGRDPEKFTGGLSLFFIVAPTKEAAREALNHPMAKFYALLAPDYYWQEHGLEHPLGKGFRGLIDIIPQDYTREELLAAMDKAPSELIANVVPYGTPDDIIAYLKDLEDAGLEHVHFNPISAIMTKELRSYAPRALWKIIRAVR
jgi:phthiodiolone/phenolphthiodiolone dimycocerosates ketoreductase